MDDEQQQEIHEAVNAALDDLAAHLGGTSDTGGPVENATQIKGRGDLGILLTDVDNRVLGRVWVAFGGALDVPLDLPLDVPVNEALADGGEARGLSSGEPGRVDIQAEVCSEVVDPPVDLETWMADR